MPFSLPLFLNHCCQPCYFQLAADLISDDADDGDDDDEGDDGDDEGQAEAEEGEDDYAGDGDVNGDSNGGVGMDHGGNKEDRGTTANIKAGKEISGKGQGKKMKVRRAKPGVRCCR